MVKFLISKGIINLQKILALYSACTNRHFEVVKFLVENGANIHRFDKIVECILSTQTIPPFQKTNEYLDIFEEECLQIIQYLVSKGANIRENKDAALKYANQYKFFKIVNYLKSKGCKFNKKKNIKFIQ